MNNEVPFPSHKPLEHPNDFLKDYSTSIKALVSLREKASKPHHFAYQKKT